MLESVLLLLEHAVTSLLLLGDRGGLPATLPWKSRLRAHVACLAESMLLLEVGVSQLCGLSAGPQSVRGSSDVSSVNSLAVKLLLL